LGFQAGVYPVAPQSTVYSIVSNTTPNLTPVNSVILRCSLVSNKGVNPPDAFYSFSPNIGFGSNILVAPSVVGWIDCKEGSFSHLDIQLVDQNFIPMNLKDNNICIQLLIKSKDER
jgi:hypothetical protein